MIDESDNQTGPMNGAWPDKVTFGWLFERMPVKVWATVATIFVTSIGGAFTLGARSSNWWIDDSDSLANERRGDQKLFNPGYPFPHPFRGFPLGTRLSVFMYAFPEQLEERPSDGDGFVFRFPDGPFGYALYRAARNETVDPRVDWVRFYVRQTPDGRTDPEASIEVWDQVNEAFKTSSYRESTSEKRTEWNDVSGYRLVLTESYLEVECALDAEGNHLRLCGFLYGDP